MFVLLHSTRHNEAMTGNDVIWMFYDKRSVFRRGIYQSSVGADRMCRVLDRSTSNHNVYSWHLRSCFSDTSRFPDTFAWSDW